MLILAVDGVCEQFSCLWTLCGHVWSRSGWWNGGITPSHDHLYDSESDVLCVHKDVNSCFASQIVSTISYGDNLVGVDVSVSCHWKSRNLNLPVTAQSETQAWKTNKLQT
jgi:hypothetical protein